MKFKKVMSTILCVAMAGALLTGCGGSGKESKPNENASASESESEGGNEGENANAGSGEAAAADLSEHVTLSFYLYGSPGAANEDILGEINKKLTEDINTSVEVKYIDWGDINTKYPLLWASGEEFDMAYASINTAVPFYTLAKQGSLYEISGLLDSCAPVLKEKIGDAGWAAASTTDGIYGVPSLGAAFNTYAFVYNKANCTAWGIDEVTDLASMEAYCDASVEHGIYPINGNAEVAMDFYRMLEGMTGDWVPAPGIATNEMYLMCADYHNYQDVMHPAFTDEFEAFVVKLDEWSKKGYWPTDILSASTGDKEMYKNGQSSSYITHMADWTGNYTAIHGQLPDQDIAAWYFAEDHNKVLKSSPAQDLTVINVNSKYPERCLMAIEKFMTEESYYRLWQNGIEGRQYEIVDGYLEKPASFDEQVDGGGFSAWAFSNNEYKIPLKVEHPSRYEKLAEWSENHINDPYTGFSFDDANVKAELSAISNVNSTLGIQLMLGKTDDVHAALEQYREQLKSAGVDTVIEELKAQLQDFTPVG